MFSREPTYKDLKEKLLKLKNEADELKKIQETLQINHLEDYETSLQMERAIERANLMAAAAEISNLEFSQIFNTVTDAIWVIDKKCKILRTNRAFSDLIGKKDADVVGQKCFEVLKNTICHDGKCPMKQVIKTRKSVELDIDIGPVGAFLLTCTPFLGLEGKPIGMLSIFKDITERKQMEAQLQKANKELKRLTVMDGLTQIANRRHFDNSLDNEWKRMSREKKALSIILCDVDHFKLYNDTYGHQKGDDCLKKVALCINDAVGRSSDLVARYGGEEFAVILPDTDGDGASIVSEKIRRGIETLKIQHKGSNVNHHVTLSLGIASVLLPQNDINQHELLKMADKALYEAKEKGRNRCEIQVV